MSKNIEMNYKTESGYEVVYPKSISDICLSSEELKTLFSLNDESVVDDAFEYVSRQLILMKHNKAGINVTVKSAGGSPLEGVPIPNITANYDGTGEVVTGSDGTAFGYCDAGSVNIAPVKCADVTYTSQSVQTLAGEMYSVNITGSLNNFQRYTSGGNCQFSNNVKTIDYTLVGGGQAGGSGWDNGGGAGLSCAGSGGNGGQVIVQENVIVTPNHSYGITIGSGGKGNQSSQNKPWIGNVGGSSSFMNQTATGGSGENSRRTSGGNGSNGNVGIAGYTSYTETTRFGGDGGGGGYSVDDNYTDITGKGGTGGADTGADGGTGSNYGGNGNSANSNTGGGGGGGGYYIYRGDDYHSGSGGNGGSGILTIRMHLKVTS